MCHCLHQQIVNICCIVDSVQELFYTEYPPPQNYLGLWLHCAHEYTDCYAEWQQDVLCEESCFKSWYYHGRNCVKRYTAERYCLSSLSMIIVDEHQKLWSGEQLCIMNNLR